MSLYASVLFNKAQIRKCTTTLKRNPFAMTNISGRSAYMHHHETLIFLIHVSLSNQGDKQNELSLASLKWIFFHNTNHCQDFHISKNTDSLTVLSFYCRYFNLVDLGLVVIRLSIERNIVARIQSTDIEQAHCC